MENEIKIIEEFLEKTDVYYYKCNYNECVIPNEVEEILKRFVKRYKELEKHISFYEKNNSYKERIIELKKENELLKHRLEVANDFIESRQEVLIPENYEDLKYILNECDLESTW